MPLIEPELDETDLRIIKALQEDARISLVELGKRVYLSAPSVAERVRRLERDEVITGYHASVDASRVGKPVMAFVRLNTRSGVADRIAAAAQKQPQVLECNRITGVECFIMKVVVGSITDLEKLIDEFTPFGEVTTSIVLSSPVPHRSVPVRVPTRTGKRR
jgi:Lrp/AsnC family transcriptional regulator, leucine-responsive regulatory protein